LSYEKPKLKIVRSSRREIMLVNALPTRLATPPCNMLVPYQTTAGFVKPGWESI
jgi:hypothetical protein